MTQTPYSPPPAVRPHRGTLILVFGILGLVVCVIFGIIAWVMGNSDLRLMQAGYMDRSGEGMTQAGRICGIISVVLVVAGACITIAVWAIMAVVVGAAAASGAGGP